MSNNGTLKFEEVAAKYPGVPRFIIRQIDANLRGVIPTEQALEWAREFNAVFEDVLEVRGKQVKRQTWGGALLRDGSLINIATGLPSVSAFHTLQARRKESIGEPYTLDVVDDQLWLVDGGAPVEEVYLAPIPEFFGKKTSRGTPMQEVVSVHGSPDCLGIGIRSNCYFWEDKRPCKYCSFFTEAYGTTSGFGDKTEAELEDLYETVTEALKEPGRWSAIRLGGGSDPRGNVRYDNEVNEYIRVLKTLGRCFGSKGLPVRLVASAFPKEQLVRLAEAGATAYEPHLEVWDEKLFEWICPGKTKYFGQKYWIENAIAAVDVFGRGYVCTQFVGGIEMAQPHGFKTIDEAVTSTLEGTKFFAQHGVTTSATVFGVGPGSIFYKQQQKPAPLEYHVKLTAGLRDIRRKHRLAVDFNDYRRCSHPDTNLSRLDYPNIEL